MACQWFSLDVSIANEQSPFPGKATDTEKLVLAALPAADWHFFALPLCTQSRADNEERRFAVQPLSEPILQTAATQREQSEIPAFHSDTASILQAASQGTDLITGW